MKQKNFLKTAFLLLTLLGGVSAAWADGTINIPQDMGNYIIIGSSTGADGFASYITKTNCQVDSRLGDANNNKYYTIGSTKSDSKVNINVTASEAGNYVFGFKSGASGCASVVTVTLTKSGTDTPLFSSGDITIANDGNWDPNIEHNFYITDVEAADYMLSLEVKNITSGSFAGNFGNFFFHKTDQLTWPTSSAYMEMSDGTFNNARDNSDNVINYISRAGGYIDDLLIYNNTADYYFFHFNIDAYKQASKVTITVSDFATGTQEAQETVVVTGAGNYMQPLTTEISTGLKKVRFDFADNDDTDDGNYLYNFRQVYFTSPTDYDALPLTGTATLNLNQTGCVFNNCQYETGNSNIGYVKNGSYADNYIVYNSNETAYYTLCAGIPWYKNGGTFTITVTDMATDTEEATATSSEITATGNVKFNITNPLTRGLKKIRFDFTKVEESDYLFNLNNVSFYKRSMNEAYDYTPVAAENVNVVLTRNINAGNWSTICLPFALTADQVKTTFGESVKLAQFTAYDSENSTVTMSEATSMNANEPYMIKVAENEYNSPVTIEGVTIEAPANAAGRAKTISSITFQGVYTSTEMAAGDFFVANNQLYKATSSTQNIKPFRAYFTGVSANARLAFFDDETTGVNDVRSKMEDVRGDFYNLAGQRVAQPTKGLYIVNGKKVVIK